MVGTKITFGTRLNRIGFLVIGLILILATACGGNDEAIPATASTGASLVSNADPLESEGIADDDIADPDAVEASTTDDRVAPAEAVVPKVAPESGSDEEAVLKVLERVTRAIREDDANEYVESCNPSMPTMSEAQASFVFESVFAPYGDMSGTTHRDVTVRTFKDDTALTESVMYAYDEVILSSSQYSFAKIDGSWYVNTYCK